MDPVATSFYIDPGTGSMLLTIIISMVTAASFLLKKAIMKLKFSLSGGSGAKASDTKLPLVIFSDDKRYWTTFEAVCQELDARGIQTQYWTCSKDDPAFSCGLEHITCRHIGEGNAAFAKLNVLNASICLSTTPGLDVYQWKRSKQVDWYVHIFHSADDGTMYRMFGLDYYDAVLGPNDQARQSIRRLEKMRNLPPKEMRTVGVPYLDRLYLRAQSMEAAAIRDGSRTILLAPSWGKSAILSRYGASFIQALLDTGYRIIVRPHPQSQTSEKQLLNNLMNKFPPSEQLEWNFDADNFAALAAADVMITDFSGVMFDFALIFGKPLIYTDAQYDSGPYDSAWFDETPWLLTLLPQLGRELTVDALPSLKDMVDELLDSPAQAQSRAAVGALAWQNRGKSAASIADYLEEKLGELGGASQEPQPAKVESA